MPPTKENFRPKNNLILLFSLLTFHLIVFCSFFVVEISSAEQHGNVKRGSGGSSKAQSVVVSMDSKWTSSILQEASEFFAQESKSLFWRFLDDLFENVQNFDEISDNDLYDRVIFTASKLLTPSRVKFLKFALSIRSHSPAIEMHRQMGLTSLAEWDSKYESRYFQHCDENFVEVKSGKIFCDVEKLREFLEKTGENDDELGQSTIVYNSDMHYNESLIDLKPRVVLYGNLHTPYLKPYHDVLKIFAENGRIDYVFRHFSTNVGQSRIKLSGYGVELAIKSTEYKAQDDSKIKTNFSDGGASAVEEEEETDLNGFNFKLLKQLHPNLIDNLNDFKSFLLDSDELTPLKVWQLQDLSFQAGQRILSSPVEEKLQALADINQNFPILARTLLKIPVKDEFRSEVELNQGKSFFDLNLSPGDSALYINGINIDFDSKDPFQLLDLLKQEEKLAAGFFRMGFRREYLSLLMSIDPNSDSNSYAIDYRGAFPDYVNDLDSDPQYQDWGNSVKLLLQPYFPGMIRPIARNIYTLIFIINPATPESRNLLKIAYSFYVHQIPIRIGLVFVVNEDKEQTGYTDPGVAILNAYNFVKTDKNMPKALRFIIDLFDSVEDRTIEAKDIIKLFKKKYPDEDLDVAFGPESDYDKGRTHGPKFLRDIGLGEAPKVLLNGIPLDDAGLTADHFEETVINEIMRITPKIQQDVMDGKLTDDAKIADYLLSKPEVMPRLNARILKPKNPVYLDLTDVYEYKADDVESYEKLPTDLAKNQLIVQSMKYLKRSDDVILRPVTVWVVADPDSDSGLNLYLNAVKSLKNCKKIRIGLLLNPANLHTPKENNAVVTEKNFLRLFKLIHVAAGHLPAHQAKNVVLQILSPQFLPKVLTGDTFQPSDLEIYGVSWSLFEKEFSKLNDQLLQIYSSFVRHVLKFAPGQNGLVVNGQIMGPLKDDEILTLDDFVLLEKYHVARLANAVAEQIEKWEVGHENDKSSDLTMRVCSLMSSDASKKKRQSVYVQEDKHSAISIPANDSAASTFDIVAVIDPLSRDAQRIIPWLLILPSIINADLKVFMNCRPKLSEMPLKNFYRFVLQPELQFTQDGAGSLKSAPFARFGNLPRKQLLTLNVMAPDSWLVESKKALYDLDNIKMEEVHGDVTAVFELEHLLLEGHCFDDVTGNPPRGLQFTLGTVQQPVIVDTTVMANLGYFQLKANPGAYVLRLREGKSADIYDITSHENTDSPSTAFKSDVMVLMNSFSGKIIRIRVSKKPDKINEHLLLDPKDGEEQSMWSSLTSKFTSLQSDDEKAKEINIFSLASGHLYERFLRIMMLSVVKHAKLPVKFWLLKNYLSPNFKEFLPHYAKHYNFSYELVQYKWPRWLHHETVKQRIMWGYKILFLDVLFPLDVKKIIFVDADQVVRVNMQELMDLDLEGAPYAYTPFCDSRTEMDGFRFWKGGYWANHLGNRKYHISALYVVDLKKFRQIAAGDRLRGQYQGLSADANSLSNLDQDLPNNMIHQVKIKSLPQEWLWCETWCDDKTKKFAKTIDLCNNPQTKEPKLESAMRIIGEWNEYDQEIRRLKDTFEKKQHLEPDTAATTKEPTKDDTHPEL